MVQIRKNFIENVFLNVGYKVYIIMEKLKIKLRLTKPKPTPYNIHMTNQTIAKPLGLIKNIKFFVHGILYIVSFIVI